ncbi:toll/interleukin-1 receptor domain-containing protein [Methyloligella sp. GL2]|uniref:toll/interleukin-1 receptor domain-containing protein n=1 Tax=Methyloligella sp. GL2 TaxID=2742204 RepID=UPI001ABA3FDF|nr:toll/interleukin-1 receptor domain-containing protein [Methyloligella sp. GL2]
MSYASEDSDAVEAIIAHMESMLPCVDFFRSMDPKKLSPGQEWRSTLLLEMEQCDLAIFLISENSLGKAWPNFELGYITRSHRTPLICSSLQHDLHLHGPFEAHQTTPLNPSRRLAAEELSRLIEDKISLRAARTEFTIQIRDRVLPLEQGWQRYAGPYSDTARIRQGTFGVTFGAGFDDGFRFPASEDSLAAPWQFLLLEVNPNKDVYVYFVVEMQDRTRKLLFLNSYQESVGFGSPKNEFQIPLPSCDRPSRLIVDTNTFIPRLGRHVPVMTRGLRVRGPTELRKIGMFESWEAIPKMLKRDSLAIQLP